jgi:uncharacterized membrane protein
MQFILFVYAVVLTIWIAQLSGRIERIERGKPAVRPAPTPKLAAQSAAKISPAPQATLRTAPPQVRSTAPSASFEETVGAHWFQWLGIGALIIALVFFLKWAFDNGIIGPSGRTMIGYILAIGAMGAGHVLRKRYGSWALTFTGGGALASYIVTWTALHRYGLMDESVAMLLNILTTVATCVLAGRYNALGLALCGIIGGFFTPILTGSEGSVFMLLSYVLLLDLGVLVLAHMRRWHALNFAAFIGTAFWETYAFVFEADASLQMGIVFIALFASLYLAIPAAYTLVRKLPSQDADISILIANGLFHFAVLMFWLSEHSTIFESVDAFCAVIFGLAFGAYSVGVYMRNPRDARLLVTSLSLAVLFVSIAVPMQFTGIWIPLIWSIEAALLLIASMELQGHTLQRFAWPVMGVAYFWFFFVPDGRETLLFSPAGFWLGLLWAAMFIAFAFMAMERAGTLSAPVLAFAFAGAVFLTVLLFAHVALPARSTLSFTQRLIEAGALIGGGYLVLAQAKRKWQKLSADERHGMVALGIGVQIVTVSYLTAEYLRGVDDGYLLSGIGSKYQAKQVGVSMLWAVYGALTLIAGFAIRLGALRSFSVGLLLLAVAKMTLVDFFSLGTGARVIGFTVLGILLVAASFLYQHFKNEVKGFLQGK